MFWLNHHHKGAHYVSLQQLQLTVQQTHTSKDPITYAATPPDQPHRCILIDCF